jgi:hypothetical protein
VGIQDFVKNSSEPEGLPQSDEHRLASITRIRCGPASSPVPLFGRSLRGRFLDYALTNRTARSFEFPSISGGYSVVERRFLPRTFSREEAIRRYVSEYLLGPAALGSSRLFDRTPL